MTGRPAPAVTELAPGRLYALSHPFALDGRVSWYPRDARGASAINVYLLIEDGQALLVDTGLAFHVEALLEQLRGLLPSSGRLSILYTRVGEYQSVSNTPRIVEVFDVEAIYGAVPECAVWSDFGPERAWGARSRLWDVPARLLGSDQMLELGDHGARRLHVANSVLRLLTNHWVYDEATRTLFSGDVFTHLRRPDESGPWTLTGEDDLGEDELAAHLAQTRYWWMPQADIAPIRQGLREYFAAHEVETIAPGYGVILRGAEVVKRHVALLDIVFARWERERAATLESIAKDGP